MTVNADFLVRCITRLESTCEALQERDPSDVFYDSLTGVAVREFERVLQQSGSLLKKRLRPYFASNREVDQLTYKDSFRHAVKHGLIPVEVCERWFAYRDNRDDGSNDSGEGFAETTLKLLPGFISDARVLAKVIAEATDD